MLRTANLAKSDIWVWRGSLEVSFLWKGQQKKYKHLLPPHHPLPCGGEHHVARRHESNSCNRTPTI